MIDVNGTAVEAVIFGIAVLAGIICVFFIGAVAGLCVGIETERKRLGLNRSVN